MEYVDFATEARNVRVAIATDGFNPFGMGAASYSCWPVFIIPLNLPPGVCMQRQNIFLSLIVPGPEYPGKNMSMYMEPIVDELIFAWEEGIITYDRATKQNFTMRVAYHTSLHDLPAYGLFCGWCVHGKMPCPVCREVLRCIWLKKGVNSLSLIFIDNFFQLTMNLEMIQMGLGLVLLCIVSHLLD
jgi:hypothetical protein